MTSLSGSREGTRTPTRLRVVQIELDEAKQYVAAFHAHSDPPLGHKWSIAAVEGLDRIVGVGIIGRPTSRVIQTADPWALEVLRVAVERDEDGRGYPNACSFLYAASWKVIRSFGFLRALTYTQDGESGASVRAAGWVEIDRRRPRRRGWDTPSRRREQRELPGGLRWEIRAKDWRDDLPSRPVVELPDRRPDQLSLEQAA